MEKIATKNSQAERQISARAPATKRPTTMGGTASSRPSPQPERIHRPTAAPPVPKGIREISATSTSIAAAV